MAKEEDDVAYVAHVNHITDRIEENKKKLEDYYFEYSILYEYLLESDFDFDQPALYMNTRNHSIIDINWA